jgi:hypothetical protein
MASPAQELLTITKEMASPAQELLTITKEMASPAQELPSRIDRFVQTREGSVWPMRESPRPIRLLAAARFTAPPDRRPARPIPCA